MDGERRENMSGPDGRLNRGAFSDLGRYVYGVAAMALGVIGLVWRDFATGWQPIQAFTVSGFFPYREALAYIAAIGQLLGGAAILGRRTARAGAVVLGIFNFIFACFWLPRFYWVPHLLGFRFPRMIGVLGGFLQEFCLVPAAVMIYTSLESRDSARALRREQISRFVFAICVLSFGLSHFFGLSATARAVPNWIPPGQQFWAIATGVFFVLAAMAIFSGVVAVLASRLLTLMLVVFSALVWVPAPFAYPHVHIAWAGNAANLSFVGAAWVVADSIARDSKQGMAR